MKKTFVMVAIVVCALAGCAAQDVDPMRSDWRTGTDYSPYRTIAPTIQCDDCRFDK